MMLRHATSAANLASIQAEGLRARSYWAATDEVLDYYAETITDEGDDVVVLAIGLHELLEFAKARGLQLEPDHPGIEEPITSAVGKSEGQIHEAWYASPRTWRDSLSIIGSLRFAGAIPATILYVENDDDESQTPLALFDAGVYTEREAQG